MSKADMCGLTRVLSRHLTDVYVSKRSNPTLPTAQY